MELSKQRTDDRQLWDLLFGIYGYPAVLLAHHLKLFPLLAEQPCSLGEVATALGIATRPAQAILSAAASALDALLTDSAQVIPGREIYDSHKDNREQAQAFTRAMHSHSMAAASAWPDKVDLSRHVWMLDIGGGSGAHSIAAALRWPNLRATVFDLGPVCEVARELITRYQMTDRVDTQVGDMWADSWGSRSLRASTP